MRSAFVFLLLALCGCAGTPMDEDGDHLSRPDPLQVHGALRAMFHEGRTGSQVSLETLLPDEELYGVGALADLDGEITILGGDVYLSRPEGSSARAEKVDRSTAGAALLVAARVSEWHEMRTREAIAFHEVDEAIADLAGAAGLGPEQRFPFLLEGEFEDLQWHVIDGSRLSGGGDSHEDHLAASVQEGRARAHARIVGFYSPRDETIFTHRGSRTHMHCVLEDPLATGHVDHVTIPAGTSLRFPGSAGEGSQ